MSISELKDSQQCNDSLHFDVPSRPLISKQSSESTDSESFSVINIKCPDRNSGMERQESFFARVDNSSSSFSQCDNVEDDEVLSIENSIEERGESMFVERGCHSQFQAFSDSFRNLIHDIDLMTLSSESSADTLEDPGRKISVTKANLDKEANIDDHDSLQDMDIEQFLSSI